MRRLLRLVAALVLFLALAGVAIGAWARLTRPPVDPSLRPRPLRAEEMGLPLKFPDAFRFGFATVAYQSEGHRRADGTTAASNWSEWEEMGGVLGGERNPSGNGFLEGFEADLDRAASLGARSFSYAIDWAKIEPERGRFDEAEIARVERIVRAMRARGLAPLVVLFHWVTPAWVQSPRRGVDLLAADDPAFSDAFLPLVEKVVPRLAPLVDEWVTFEEPWSLVGAGYLDGEHPPGLHYRIGTAKRVLVDLMRFHARVYRRVHDLDPTASVGIETIACDVGPARAGNADDLAAAARCEYVVNHHFVRALTSGEVDEDFDGAAETKDPALAGTLDWIGLNYYQRLRVHAAGPMALLPPIHGAPMHDVRDYDPQAAHSDMWQEICAPGLRRVIEAYARYRLPLRITENGIADARDDRRAGFLLEHMAVVAQAIRDGHDVRGYDCWTISDNFEWNLGTSARFGLFRVDFGAPGFPRTRTRGADLYEAVAKGRVIDGALWEKFGLKEFPVAKD